MLAATFETASLLILRAFFAFGTGVSTGHISIFMSLDFTFDPLPETCGFSHEGGLRSRGSVFRSASPSSTETRFTSRLQVWRKRRRFWGLVSDKDIK
jgi:hypothetical protein